MFTGTLIEELMATVERAETKILAAEAADVDCLLAALQENANYDSRYLGVA